MTEDQLEQETLGWLTEAGYSHCYGLDIAPDGPAPERSDYNQVLLVARLREAIDRLNPLVPPVARIDALQQVLNLDTPVLLAANRTFHQLLVNGVPVEYQKDGETRGDFVRMIDFADVGANEWLAVNQFSVKGAKYTRRPDIILFVNGLPPWWRPERGRGLAYPGIGQEHYHDLLCCTSHARSCHGESDHCRYYRPQRSGRATVRRVLAVTGVTARITGAG